MSAASIISAILIPVVVAQVVLVGNHKWYGWAVGLIAEAMWAAVFILTGQWILLGVVPVYAAVFTRNLRKWRRAGGTA